MGLKSEAMFVAVAVVVVVNVAGQLRFNNKLLECFHL